MKYILVLFIACTLFPLTIQAQMETVMDMHHDDDTLDIKYTREMLQGKLWEFVGDVGYASIEFKGDSLYRTFVLENKKYVFPCIYYLSDSYQMDYKEENEDFNRAGKYIQVKYLDANCDGTGEIGSQSFRIKKLTDDTLELIEWQSQNSTEQYHAKPITGQ